MGYLILHIDLDFISGVILTDINDDVYSLKSTDNRDPERFWLFFENDQFNHRIKYKKEFRQKVYDKKADFIGDILLRDLSNESFLLKDQNYELLELLEESGILSGIKSQFIDKTGNDLISTMIAFSDNIPLSNREILRQFLLRKGFSIAAFGIPLPELLCYYQIHKLANTNFIKTVFVLDAWNDNLNLSALYKNENFYMRQQDNYHTYPNMGKDPKQKIIVEYVVDSLAHETCFLKSKERKDIEYKRQEKHAEDWLNRLALVDTLILQDVTLANCAKTKYTITIEHAEIERRTQKYFTEVLTKFRALRNLIKAKDDYIILLSGNALSNTLMKKRFVEEVGEDKLYVIDNTALKNVYAQYPEAWKIAEEKIRIIERDKKYELLIEEGAEFFKGNLLDETLCKYIEARKIRNTQEVNNKINDIEIKITFEKKKKQDFDNQISKSQNCIKLNKLTEAKGCLEKALEIFPNDAVAISILNDVTTRISIANQTIKDFLKIAEFEYLKENWLKAKEFFTTVLNIQPDNTTAKEKLENCERYILLGPIIKKADDLFLKQNYKDAQIEYRFGNTDKYCVKRYDECDNIIKNQREIRNIMIESKSLVDNKKKLQKLEIRLSELIELVKQIQLADPTNKQYEQDIKTYESYIVSMKSENGSKPATDQKPIEIGNIKIAKTKDPISIKNPPKKIEIPSQVKIVVQEKKIGGIIINSNSEAENLFLIGRFIEAKQLFNAEKSTLVIQDRIAKCNELRKFEQQIKGFLTESVILVTKKDKIKAKIRLYEIEQIDIVYRKLKIVDERIALIKSNLISIK